MNKQPVWQHKDEPAFYNNTPKHVLFALLRDFAAQIDNSGSIDTGYETGSWISEAKERIGVLRSNGLLP